MLFGDFAVQPAAEILVSILFALALDLMLGHGGFVSLGHAACFAIGGYGLVILLTTCSRPLLPSFLAAVLLSAAVAAVVGYVCVRPTAIYLAMLTPAVSQLVWAVAFQ